MKTKILVVDDEWAILELLKTKLGKRGYSVTGASNGKEFKRLAFEVNPDLLILDIWLGNQGGGPQLYDEVIRAGFNPDVPVIFISALVEEGHPPTRAPHGGRFALYGKPLDFDLLLDDIRRLTSNDGAVGQENFRIKEKKGGANENNPSDRSGNSISDGGADGGFSGFGSDDPGGSHGS